MCCVATKANADELRRQSAIKFANYRVLVDLDSSNDTHMMEFSLLPMTELRCFQIFRCLLMRGFVFLNEITYLASSKR